MPQLGGDHLFELSSNLFPGMFRHSSHHRWRLAAGRLVAATAPPIPNCIIHEQLCSNTTEPVRVPCCGLLPPIVSLCRSFPAPLELRSGRRHQQRFLRQ